jgi:site-specific DNA recombinase
MRCAIYARYSSDRQNERSIEDQIAVCTRHATAKGWAVVGAFTDAAISGAHMVNRPGLNAAVAGAEATEFEILLVEDEDRIARSLEHMAHVANRLRYAGARIATLNTDEVSDMHVAFKGLMSADYLRNLSQKTSRGMRANAERGLATGAKLYGYVSAPGGALAIVETEAQIVRRIFTEYATGRTPRAIAEGLNAEHIPSPRGGPWNASTINGSRQRANGVLNTELYVGVKVWNRLTTRKDPRTGRKLSTPRPEVEWKRTPVPDLRIVGDDDWATARARKLAEGSCQPAQLVRKRPSIFSGLVRCGACGSAYTIATSGRMACTGRRERGPSFCGNRRTLRRDHIEGRVLAALRDRLLAPEAVQTYIQAYHRAWQAKRASEAAERAPLERRMAEIERRLERAVEAILDGTATARLKESMKALESEQADIKERLDAAGAAIPPIELHPGLAEAYARKVETLQNVLADAAADGARQEIVTAVRDLVEKIEVRPLSDDRGAEVEIILHGRLAAFLRPSKPGAPAPLCMGAVVAGGGIEPPTCGL